MTRTNAFILGICLCAVFFGMTGYKAQEMYHGWPVSGVGCDYRIYWHAANGDNDSWARSEWWYPMTPSRPYGWLYKDTLKPVFYWLTFGWLPAAIATHVWIGCMILVYSVILVKLLRTEHGWTVALLTLKPFVCALQSGNVSTLLSLMATTIPGAILAACVKPYCIVFVVLLAVARLVAQKNNGKTRPTRCGYLRGYGLADPPASHPWEVALSLALGRGRISRSSMDSEITTEKA